MNTVKLQSIITCPNCGHRKEETMPTDSCQYFYECEKCRIVLKPKQDHRTAVNGKDVSQ